MEYYINQDTSSDAKQPSALQNYILSLWNALYTFGALCLVVYLLVNEHRSCRLSPKWEFGFSHILTSLEHCELWLYSERHFIPKEIDVYDNFQFSIVPISDLRVWSWYQHWTIPELVYMQSFKCIDSPLSFLIFLFIVQ